MAGRIKMHKHVDTLPLVGHSRWRHLARFVGVSRETWRKRCRDGKAPQPIQLSEGCTVWLNAEIHAYLRDPLAYQVASEEEQEVRRR